MQLTGGGYSTVCVRLCDGYFYPLRFSTNRSQLMSDHATCENSCSAPSKLFVHATGTDIDQAYDLMGKRYTSLPNAFLYRSEYRSDCRCKPDPWTEEAKAVHERYAALDPDPMARALKAERTARARASAPVRRKRIQSNVGSTTPRHRYVTRSNRRVGTSRRGSQRVRSYRPGRPAARSRRLRFFNW